MEGPAAQGPCLGGGDFRVCDGLGIPSKLSLSRIRPRDWSLWPGAKYSIFSWGAQQHLFSAKARSYENTQKGDNMLRAARAAVEVLLCLAQTYVWSKRDRWQAFKQVGDKKGEAKAHVV